MKPVEKTYSNFLKEREALRIRKGDRRKIFDMNQ
jgi:hypothetical protein